MLGMVQGVDRRVQRFLPADGRKVAEGEDIKEVPSQAQTAAKLEAWAEEGLHEQDFFFLCLAWLRDWNDALSAFYLLMAGR